MHQPSIAKTNTDTSTGRSAAPEPRRAPNLALVIASADRPDVLHETVISLYRQQVLPAQIILALPGDEHVRRETRGLPGVEIVLSQKGLTRQRNRAIEALAPGVDVVTFIDDDAELRDDYLAWTVRLFGERREVVLATGRELADGFKKGGFTRNYARHVIAADTLYLADTDALDVNTIDPSIIYGCNMSVRRSVFDEARFDERLPLYAWAEDYDFALSCAPHGCVVRIENCRMVHLGVSSGRLPGKRYGFAQVMNAIYIWRKGTNASPCVVTKMVLRAVLGNATKLFLPGQKVDRWGRLRGNFIALGMVLRGRIEPEHILQM